ncbi:uncharacterized protein ARMOST_12750 [Armillaria ostoyae]|uniref:Uncharacterized protein n=1 Tax=Armillaria ostoyae TaxID=47428 RepID=A0A284RKT9_ARMOS|nr:uncharacterized protein ARMOST_12750 [Armillaria ostoyae]
MRCPVGFLSFQFSLQEYVKEMEQIASALPTASVVFPYGLFRITPLLSRHPTIGNLTLRVIPDDAFLAPGSLPELKDFNSTVECLSQLLSSPYSMPQLQSNVALHDTIATLDVPLSGLNVSEEQDSVLFEVRYHEVVIASTNGFNKFLDHHVPRVSATETFEILNIILHAIHRISCFQFRHSIDTLMVAVGLFPKYGLEPKKFVSPSSPLFNDIRYKMPLSPLKYRVYNSASTMDLVWNNWTKISTEKPAYATDNDDDEKDHMHRVLRRGHANALFIRPRIRYLADHEQRNLFLQTIRTGPTKGLSVPFNKAYLLPGRSKTEFMIRVDGKPTRWYTPLHENCFIDEKKMSPQEARATITSTWGSKRVSQEIANPFLKR